MAVPRHPACAVHLPASRDSRARLSCLVMVSVLLLAACGTQGHRAPVEDRGKGMARADASKIDTGGVQMPLGFENLGKPGFYTVKPGDTLIRIGLETGQNWRDLGAWNNLENPSVISVGQVLRVVPPAESTAVVASPISSGSATATATSPNGAAPAPSPAPATVKTTTGSDENLSWIWPAQGRLLAGFDEAKNKGLDIAGKAGDPVMASADGRVVYAGAGLRGYGNLIILKHNNTFLTAYAHNQTLLVKEDQAVRRGQKIAEMGSSDSDRVKLHFEIRRQGKPEDPAKFLPAK
jgi:lipoprotein NlpD